MMNQSQNTSQSKSVPFDARRVFYLATCALLIGLSSGCGDGLVLVPVEGTVLLDGQPLAYKSLLFLPEGETGGNGAGGFTDGDGNYKLNAVVFGATTDRPGCPPGTYRVVVSEPTIPISAKDFTSDSDTDSGDEPVAAVGPVSEPPAQGVPRTYTTAKSTPLVMEVSESPELNFTIELSSE